MCSFLIDSSEAELFLSKYNKEYKNSTDVNLNLWYTSPYTKHNY